MQRIVVNADFFTETHRISGRVEVGAAGLIGLLNDTNSSLVEAQNAYVSRLQEPTKIVAHSQTATLNKSNLTLVILARREDISPTGSAQTGTGYTRLVSSSVLVTTPTFEVRGTVETLGKPDPAALIIAGPNKFMPLYRTMVIATLYPDIPYSGEAVLLNRAQVQAFAPLIRTTGMLQNPLPG